MHCLFFIYPRKFYVRSHGKITRRWKSTLRVYGGEQIELLPGMVKARLEVALFPMYYESSALIARPGCLWRENEGHDNFLGYRKQHVWKG